MTLRIEAAAGHVVPERNLNHQLGGLAVRDLCDLESGSQATHRLFDQVVVLAERDELIDSFALPAGSLPADDCGIHVRLSDPATGRLHSEAVADLARAAG